MEAEARSEVDRIRSVQGAELESGANRTRAVQGSELEKTAYVEALPEANRIRPAEGAGSKSKTKREGQRVPAGVNEWSSRVLGDTDQWLDERNGK